VPQVTAWWGQQNTTTTAASTAATAATTAAAPHKQTHSISAGRLSRLRLQAALPPLTVQLSSGSAAVLCTLLASHSENQAPPAPPPWLQRSRSWTDHSSSAVDSTSGGSGSRHNSVSSPRLLLLRTLDGAAPDFTEEVLDELVSNSKLAPTSSSNDAQATAAEQQQQQQQHTGALVELQLSAVLLSLRLSASTTAATGSSSSTAAATEGSSTEAALISVTLTDVQCDCSSAVVAAADDSTTPSRAATMSVALGGVTVLDLQSWCAAGTAGYPLQRLLCTVADHAVTDTDTASKQVTQLSWCTNGVVDVCIPCLSVNWNPNTVAAVMMFVHSLSRVRAVETAGATAQSALPSKQRSSPTKAAAAVAAAAAAARSSAATPVLRVCIEQGQVSLNKDHLCRQLLVATFSNTTIEGSKQSTAGASMTWSGSLQSLRLRDASTAATHWRDLLGPHSAAADTVSTTTTFSISRDAQRPQGLLLQLHLGECRFVYLQQTVMEWFDYVMTALLGSAVWSPWLLLHNSDNTTNSSSSDNNGSSSGSKQLLAQQEAEAVATATHFSITADATQLLLPVTWQSQEHVLLTGSALTVQAAPARAAMGAATCTELVSQWTVRLADMGIATCHSSSTAAAAEAATALTSADSEAQKLPLQMHQLLQQQQIQQRQQQAVEPLALELQARWVALQHRRQPDDAVYEVCVTVGSKPAITLLQPVRALLSAVLAGNLQSEPVVMVTAVSSSSGSTSNSGASSISSSSGVGEVKIEYGCDRAAAEATSFVLKVELRDVQCAIAPDVARLQV
jgi:hypothetical protein